MEQNKSTKVVPCFVGFIPRLKWILKADVSASSGIEKYKKSIWWTEGYFRLHIFFANVWSFTNM